jgi:hypothetical protein
MISRWRAGFVVGAVSSDNLITPAALMRTAVYEKSPERRAATRAAGPLAPPSRTYRPSLSPTARTGRPRRSVMYRYVLRAALLGVSDAKELCRGLVFPGARVTVATYLQSGEFQSIRPGRG